MRRRQRSSNLRIPGRSIPPSDEHGRDVSRHPDFYSGDELSESRDNSRSGEEGVPVSEYRDTVPEYQGWSGIGEDNTVWFRISASRGSYIEGEVICGGRNSRPSKDESSSEGFRRRMLGSGSSIPSSGG